ncbi:HAMP domain-containing sensor histidine kinase [Kribbella deserti]|uniref:Signal transduction histidine-protein kinase/phosphatase MprB n=1 Tax=Kribbella deserti TaxID=1926257 RepID=A0ABV6QSE8_9ACTN
MRRQILVLVAATTTLVLVAFLVPLALVIRQVAADRAISAARQQIEPLVAITGTATPGQLETMTLAIDADSPERPVSIYLPDGTILGSQVPPTERVTLAQQPRSFSYKTDNGIELYVGVAVGAPQATVIRVFVPTSGLTAGVRQVWLILAGLGLVLLAVAILVADRLATSLLRPVRRLADTASRLEAGDLTARAEVTGPRELREVGGALDRLAARINELLVAERERVADISHRLRTPLTALRLEAGSLRDPEERAGLGATAEELRRVVDDVIAAARLPMREAVSVECEAVAAVRARAEFWKVLADDQDRELTIDLPAGPIPVRLAKAELDSAVDALLGNVFAHTPDGAPIAISVTPEPGSGCRLVVGDGGPGLPDADLVARGESGAGSTGLGLDIARRAAESSGGHLTPGRSPLGGAQLTLTLGPPLS